MIAIPEGEITNYTLGGAYLAVRRAVIEALDLLGLSSGNVDEYINNRALRDDLIVAEFNKRIGRGESAKTVLSELAESYCLSRKTVENIVYRPK